MKLSIPIVPTLLIVKLPPVNNSGASLPADASEDNFFDLQNLIASVGFPITLSMYLLVRIEGKLQSLSDSINELSKNELSDIMYQFLESC